MGNLTAEDRRMLREVALASIRSGLEDASPLHLDPADFPPALREPGACFVTLELDGRLRGCVGSMEPRRSLVEDVAQNAYASAFQDYRFSPLTEKEFSRLDYHISRLTPLEPLPANSREELMNSLVPSVDGLLMEDPPHRATFLPQVWESMAGPEDFLRELLRKAGLSTDHWSSTITFHRYRAEEF